MWNLIPLAGPPSTPPFFEEVKVGVDTSTVKVPPNRRRCTVRRNGWRYLQRNRSEQVAVSVGSMTCFEFVNFIRRVKAKLSLPESSVGVHPTEFDPVPSGRVVSICGV